MARWEAGEGPSPVPRAEATGHHYHPYFVGGKRRVSHGEGSDFDPEWFPHSKRPRIADLVAFASEGTLSSSTPIEPLRPHELPFFVRTCPSSPARNQEPECSDPDPEPDNEPDLEPVFDYNIENDTPVPVSVLIPIGGGCAMERTASGLSISSNATRLSNRDSDDHTLLEDLEAARMVRDRLAASARRPRNTQHERILRTLINPKTREAEFPIDDDALASIFSAANEIFFSSRLSRRVTWDWSHESAQQYRSSVIGTTAFRRSAELGGYETLVVLSRPILMSAGFSRRLLISTFLHEIIHCYLFIVCGSKARVCGGHTQGFHQIAAMIDHWAGPEHLRLREMEADLESYRAESDSAQMRPQPPQLIQVLRNDRRPHPPQPSLSPATHWDDPDLLEETREQNMSWHPRQELYCPIGPLPESRPAHPVQHVHQLPTSRGHKFYHGRRDDGWDEWVDDRWTKHAPRRNVPGRGPTHVDHVGHGPLYVASTSGIP